MYDERFGIKHPEPIHTIETEGRIEAQPLGSGLIYLRSSDGEQERVFEVDAYSSGSVAALIREESHRIRLKSTFVNFFIHPMTTPLTWQIRVSLPPSDEDTSLTDFRGFVNLLTLWDGAAPSGEVELELRMEEHNLAGRVVFPEPPPERFIELAKAIRCATRIATHLRIPSAVRMSVNGLYSQRRSLEVIDAAFRGDTLKARVIFWLSSDETWEDIQACMPFLLDLWLGDRRVVVSGAYLGHAARTGVMESGCYELSLEVDSVRVLNVEVDESGTNLAVPQVEILDHVASEFSDLNVIRWWADQ